MPDPAGASDTDIMRLATCYWFSVEFGLCYEDGHPKAYGAGLLSSFGELEYACAPYRPAGGTDDRPEIRPWVPEQAAMQEFGTRKSTRVRISPALILCLSVHEKCTCVLLYFVSHDHIYKKTCFYILMKNEYPLGIIIFISHQFL